MAHSGDTLYGSVSEIESCSSRISRHYGGKSALGKTKKLHSRKDKKALLLNQEFLRRIPRTMILKKTSNHPIRRTAPFISGRSEKRDEGGRVAGSKKNVFKELGINAHPILASDQNRL